MIIPVGNRSFNPNLVKIPEPPPVTFLTTEDGVILTTESGIPLITEG